MLPETIHNKVLLIELRAESISRVKDDKESPFNRLQPIHYQPNQPQLFHLNRKKPPRIPINQSEHLILHRFVIRQDRQQLTIIRILVQDNEKQLFIPNR